MHVPLFEAFRGKNVFLTGHTGFKGSWLSLWLSRLGANVTGYALAPPTTPNNFTISRIEDVLTNHYEADIRDADAITRTMRECNPDLVLHLAAQSVVRESYRIPRETFDVNVMGTASVLEAVQALKKPCSVVVITSDKCYQNVEQVWGYRESDAFGDNDPYGASKGAAEILLRAYRHSFFPPERLSDHGVKLASARAGNVIGGGDWTEHALIVDIVKAIAAGVPVEIRNPGAYRPWQHVLQALSGYMTLAARLLTEDNPQYCSGWNIGPQPGNELPVSDIVALFLKEWGNGSWIDASNPQQLHEAHILRLCIDKALWKLNWRPGWTVYETLQQTARWYMHYFEEAGDMQAFSFRQIDEYETVFARALSDSGTCDTVDDSENGVPETVQKTTQMTLEDI